MEKEKWLYLEPYTFIWNRPDSAYVYNSLSCEGFRFTHSPETYSIAEKLADTDHLGSVKLDENQLTSVSVMGFVNKIKRLIAGNVLTYKPIIMPPLLNLQTDIDRLRKDERSSGENALQHLYQLDIEFGSYNNNDYINRLIDFIRPLKGSFIRSINLHNAGLLDKIVLEKTHINLDEIQAPKEICLYLDEFVESFVKLKHLDPKSYRFKVIIPGNVDVNMIPDTVRMIEENNRSASWEFRITSYDEYLPAKKIIEQYSLSLVEIEPVYNGDNKQFFEDNIYVTEEDLQTPGLSKWRFRTIPTQI
jgi:pseudo-rSAM protein